MLSDGVAIKVDEFWSVGVHFLVLVLIFITWQLIQWYPHDPYLIVFRYLNNDMLVTVPSYGGQLDKSPDFQRSAQVLI